MGATKQIARGRMEQYQGKTAKKITYFDNVLFDGAAYFNVSLKVNVQKFENKIEFLVSMNDVQKPRDRPIIRTSSEDQEMTGDMIQMAPIMWHSRQGKAVTEENQNQETCAAPDDVVVVEFL